MGTETEGRDMQYSTDRLLRLRDVESLVGMKKTKLYSLIGSGAFPRPYKPNGPKGASRWKLSDVSRWIDALPSAA